MTEVGCAAEWVAQWTESGFEVRAPLRDSRRDSKDINSWIGASHEKAQIESCNFNEIQNSKEEDEDEEKETEDEGERKT